MENKILRDILRKGPKYREKVEINWEEALKCISQGLDKYIETWCTKNAIPIISISPWKHKIRELIQGRILLLRNRPMNNFIHKTLNDPSVKLSLSALRDRFVICPIDKATGNFSFVCKRFYATVLLKELGLKDGPLSMTYAMISDQEIDSITKKHVDDLKSKFSIDTDNSDIKLPNMYWLPKKHKNPTKFRFIIAAPACSMKPLAKHITSIFKLFYRQIESFHKKGAYFTGVNSFWCILNNYPIRNVLRKINSRGRAKSITTFDFSTLYTKIPHDKLLFVLNTLIDFCFNGGLGNYLAVNKGGARWVEDIGRNKITFDKNQLKIAVKYLIDNCYFTVGTKIVRQIIGIPMGSDPAPFFANLFLYYYENQWVDKIKKVDINRARKYSKIFRFIDDLGAINDDGEFGSHFNEIYPPEMELTRENTTLTEASFLDLDISIINGKYKLKLFDKRDHFPFEIVRMPYCHANIPSKMFYSSFGAELLRIARASTHTEDFSFSANKLISRLLKQGGKIVRVNNSINKTFGRHAEEFNHLFSCSLDMRTALTIGN